MSMWTAQTHRLDWCCN